MFLQGKEYLMDRCHSIFFKKKKLLMSVIFCYYLSLDSFSTQCWYNHSSLSLSSFFSCFGFCLNAKENPQDLNLFPVGHAKV